MPALHVTSRDDPRIEPYLHTTDAGLLRGHGLFVAEGRLVVRTLLTASPFRTRSVLVTRSALDGLGDVLPEGTPLPVFVVPQDLMNGIVGFNIHRGCLALGERPPERSIPELLDTAASAKPPCRVDARRLVVLENVGNADNVGGIFRCAAAFGAGVVLGPHCADPLYRKAIRTSMGAALRVPFASASAWPDDLTLLRRAGYEAIALTPSPDAEDLEDAAAGLAARPRVALLVGAEGQGLTDEALAASDCRVRIRIDKSVDSLNVAVAAGIALHRICRV